MEKNQLLFPELARVLKYKIPVGENLFLRQCASGINLFHLPNSYRYPTGNIAGYFISLNWDDKFIVLEKERKENNEYFIINREIETVFGPYSWDEYETEYHKRNLNLPLIPVSKLDWVINF